MTENVFSNEPRPGSRFSFRDGHFLYTEECMGTGFAFKGFTLLEPSVLGHHLERAGDILHEADRTFSTYKPESPISRLAAGQTTLTECPPVVAEIWDCCEAWEKTTDGWFSAFTPQNTFDPSGLVKTWAAKAAFKYLLENGITDLTLNAGGDILIGDATSDVVSWRVAIHKPVSVANPDAGVLTVLDLRGTDYRAVCTSGSAERGSHIWDPKAPGKEPAGSLLQATVVARDLVAADVWATAVFAMGPRSIEELTKYNNAHPESAVEALIVLNDGGLNATEGFIELFAKPE
jgi:thiamine biosynthesis lipoprotein